MCRHLVKRLISRAALLAVLGLCTGVLFGQTAEISGRVVDQSDAVVVGAKVEALQVSTGVVRPVITNDAGYYTFPLLPPGQYRISVSREGFRTATRDQVQVDVNQDLRLDFTLQLGTTTETVMVRGEAPLVNLSDATVGKVIGQNSMTSLPLNGRNALSLVTLTPSVRFNASSPSGFADRGATLAAFQVNGGPSGSNNIELDGTTNINSRLGDVNVNPAVDAIQEFKVQSAVVPAESGFTLGGVVSMITRSGGNDFHGTLYEFLRNDKLDARNTFAARKAPLRYNQYGGSIGGRIFRDKTFFFGNFEEWRLSLAYTAVGTTMTAAQRAGDFSNERDSRGTLITIFDPATTRTNPSGGGFLRDPFPGNRIPTSRLDRVAQNLLQFYPLPNRTPDDPFTNLNNFTANLNTRKNARQLNLKFDHYFSMANRAAFRFTMWNHYDDQANNGAGIFPDLLVRQRTDRYRNLNYNFNDQHTFSPNLINELRLGASTQPFLFTPLNYNQGWPEKLGFGANVPNLIVPIVTITGYQQIPTSFLGTIGNIGLQTYQLADSLTWIRGKHSIKLGTDIRRYNTNLNLCQQCNGTFNFNSRLTANPQSLPGTGFALASFLLGTAASASIDVNAGVSYESYSYSLFAQDDWKITPRLTLNLGLRWDYQQPPVERNNNLSNFNPLATDPRLNLPGRMEYAGVDFGRSLQERDWNDFGPRIGFAWDAFGKGTTVIRGGYGVYYAQAAIFANDYATLGFRPNITTYAPPGGAVDLPALTLSQGFPFAPNPPPGTGAGTKRLRESEREHARTQRPHTVLAAVHPLGPAAVQGHSL
jgi:outer membrane receptor protein involved in Fe transport